MNDDDRPKAARPGWRKRLRWLGLGVLLLLLLASGPVCKFLYDRHKAQVELQAVIRDLDEHDPGWRLEEIQVSRPGIPDDENSGVAVMAALRCFPDNWRRNTLDDWFGHPVGEELEQVPRPQLLTIKQYDELQPTLRTLEPALVEARRIADLPRGRYTLDWTDDIIGTNAGVIQDARSVAVLLRLDALLLAQNNEIEQAWTSNRAIFNTARSIGEPDTLIHYLVRVAIRIIALRSMERTLAQGQVSAASLETMQRLLENEAALPLLAEALRNERAGFHRLFTNLESGIVKLSEFDQTSSKGDFFGHAMLYMTQDVVVPSGHAWYLCHMSKMIESISLPLSRQDAQFSLLEQEVVSAPLLGRLLTPAHTKLITADRRSQAHLRCAIVALAIEHYRAEHGHWPTTLEDLTRNYLTEIPLDPFDRKPLRFRQRVDHVVIYSVGPDGVDDDGNVSNDDRATPGTDIGFRLWNPDKRRQPAK